MSRSAVPPLPVSEKPRALAVEPAAVLVPLGLFVAVVCVAAPDGSYFPSSWGWASLAFLWAAAIGLVVQKRTTVAPLDVAYLGAWLVLLAWIAASALWSETTTQTMYEVERTLVYVSFAAALAVLAQRSLPFLLPARGRRAVVKAARGDGPAHCARQGETPARSRTSTATSSRPPATRPARPRRVAPSVD
jgi:hypothetical protein